MAQTNWEADKMLDVYIHDYLVKRDLKATAQAFQAEGKVSTDPVAIDAPGGFLFEWWSVFWDIFIARTNEKHSDVAASYLESQMNKAREQHHQPLNSHHQQHQQQQNLQMQQFLFQRHAQQQLQQQQHQQQRADGSHMLNGSVNRLLGNEVLLRQNSGNATAVNPKAYEDRIDRLKTPLHCDSLDDAGSKQRFGENTGQLLDANHSPILKPSGNSDQSAVQMLHGAGGGIPQQMQGRNHQAESIADMKGEMNSSVNSRGAAPDTSFIGLSGSNQPGNGLTLKGWPLAGFDHLRSGFQKPFMQQQAHQQHQQQQQQSFHQLSMLTPQQQIVLAQQNLTCPSDSENRRMQIMLNNRNMNAGKDDAFQSAAAAAALQAGCSALPRGDVEMVHKLKMAQLHHHQQQLQSHALSNQQEKIGGPGSATMDGTTMSSFRGNDQAMKNQNGRKRKQAVSSSGPANSSGTANTTGPSPSSAPSTPSTQIPGDVISMPALPQSSSSSKPLVMFGTTDGNAALASQQNQLWGDKDFELQAEMDHFVDDGSLDDNVESFLSHDDDDADPRDPVGRSTDIGEGFTFAEVGSVRASTSKVVCCHFSSDGKLLATGGNDKKVVLWHTDSLKPKTPLEEHSSMITDVRFSPSLPRLATSSFDKTIRVWDADNPGYSLRTFTGHSASVMSLDFHPNKEDLLCSCDGDGDVRYWSINNGTCVRRLKGGNIQMRFQPRFGRYLAAASDNLVSVFDSETQTCCHSLQGHTKPILSLCWNACGDFLASVSEESVRVWSFGSGSDGECVHERSCTANKFHSSAFHPTYASSLLVIGCYQSMELWSMAENKMMSLSAHEGLIASLSSSVINGLVASAGHDKIVKLWK